MAEPPDYRSEKMESYEGRGIAASRWHGFLSDLPGDVVSAAGFDGPHFNLASDDRAKELSDLIGFWVTWHVVGGFEELEDHGWHRATIFRKIRRFRAVFDAHPDEFTFDWINLDLDRAWMGDLLFRLGVEDQEKQ